MHLLHISAAAFRRLFFLNLLAFCPAIYLRKGCRDQPECQRDIKEEEDGSVCAWLLFNGYEMDPVPYPSQLY